MPGSDLWIVAAFVGMAAPVASVVVVAAAVVSTGVELVRSNCELDAPSEENLIVVELKQLVSFTERASPGSTNVISTHCDGQYDFNASGHAGGPTLYRAAP